MHELDTLIVKTAFYYNICPLNGSNSWPQVHADTDTLAARQMIIHHYLKLDYMRIRTEF